MGYSNRKLLQVLRGLDLGSSIAEQDNQLESARIDTSAFTDLIADRVDLIPGTKGSGKTALYRIIVDFLPSHMLQKKKVVIAHGVRHHGDQVFQVFKDRFGGLSEEEFVNFWCIYLVSLANEHFIKSSRYEAILSPLASEISTFNSACRQARIPSFSEKRTLRDVLDWALTTLAAWRPTARYKIPDDWGEFELDLFGNAKAGQSTRRTRSPDAALPTYVERIRQCLERILESCDLHLWLMIDRLDEIFPRRSPLETRALRGLLRVLRLFDSPRIRVKIFLRDDILEQIVGEKGFTALTHVTARRAKSLEWTEEQILLLIVRRLFAHKPLANYLKVDQKRLTSPAYAKTAFYRVVPRAVYRGERRIPTLRWIYRRAADGRGVVTPRDVIDLLRNAVQHRLEVLRSCAGKSSDEVIDSESIRDGYERMSRDKLTNYLKAEFPHLWQLIAKFTDGKTEYSPDNLARMFGVRWEKSVGDLVSIGVLRKEKKRSDGTAGYKIPFLYRVSLGSTQGRMRY